MSQTEDWINDILFNEVDIYYTDALSLIGEAFLIVGILMLVVTFMSRVNGYESRYLPSALFSVIIGFVITSEFDSNRSLFAMINELFA